MSAPYDVIVVGGGPAGSAAATFVAMQGHKVLLLEAERFPRHQIGESLLPATVQGVCAMLGVTEDLRRANFQIKYGTTWLWGKSAQPWDVAFGPASPLPGFRAFAYQVERMKFDAILLNNARRKGVQVREGCPVSDAITDNGRIVGVRFTDERGREATAHARFVVDASGHRRAIARHIGERIYSRFFQNVALYGYYAGGRRFAPPRDGNTLSAVFEEGWFWYIPLGPELTSVGAVVAKEHADRLKEGREAAMDRFIQSCPVIRDFLANATRITTGPYGELRVRKDWSYCNSTMWAPGAALIGDCACFIDPVFSTGVHLSTYAGLLVARSINSCLRGGLDEQRSFDEFQLRYRREFAHFYDFLIAFYDSDKEVESYFWEARKVLNTEERANDAFIRLISGLSETGEPLFHSGDEFFNERKDIGEMFRRSLFRIPDSGAAPSAPEVNVERFTHDFERGGVIELHHLGTRRSLGAVHSQPLVAGGLVPSTDGLHWAEAASAASAAVAESKVMAR